MGLFYSPAVFFFRCRNRQSPSADLPAVHERLAAIAPRTFIAASAHCSAMSASALACSAQPIHRPLLSSMSQKPARLLRTESLATSQAAMMVTAMAGHCWKFSSTRLQQPQAMRPPDSRQQVVARCVVHSCAASSVRNWSNARCISVLTEPSGICQCSAIS